MRAFLSLWLFALLALTAPALSGCSNKADQPAPVGKNPGQQPPAPPQQPPVTGQPHPDQRGTGIWAVGDRVQIEHNLKQLATMYTQYCIQNPRPPANEKVFANDIRRQAPNLADLFDKGHLGLFPSARQNANLVAIYDVPGSSDQQHYVVMGNGDVRTITRAELQQVWQQQKGK
jgi:hypothetical protein